MEKRLVASLGECRHGSPRRLTVSDDVLVPSIADWPGGEIPPALELLEKAGPRPRLFFDPRHVHAGVVTCGGLCPGLNSVIRSLYLELHHGYGVKSVTGFCGGFRGLLPHPEQPPIALDSTLVKDIHKLGGTILGTSRGPVDVDIAVGNLVSLGIDALFCIGGDGTQRGAAAIDEVARGLGYPIAVVGIPKTIDNDVPYVARTFGFGTAVEEAQRVIGCAHVEARSVLNGVSLVKLMGRQAGFIAAAATVASQDVNVCLVPEVPFELDGPDGLLALVERRLAERQHAVIVVAEGAGQELIPGETGLTDASGNVKLQDVGEFLMERIGAHFRAKGVRATLRYFDPNYEIRSCPANTDDAILCDRFARHAAHAAMAGRTGLVIGLVHGRFVFVPSSLVSAAQKRLRVDSELWRAVIAATGQPTVIG